MIILDLTVSVKPKEVLEWIGNTLFYLPSLICKQPNGSYVYKCPDYVWREIEP